MTLPDAGLDPQPTDGSPAVVNRLARLQEVTAALSEALTQSQVAEVVLQKGFATAGVAAGSMALLRGGVLELLVSIGYADSEIAPFRRIPLGSPTPLTDAARTAQPVWIESPDELHRRYAALPVASGAAGPRYQAWVAQPLVVDGVTLGVMGLAFPSPRTFTEDDRALIGALCGLCGQALRRAQLFDGERRARAAAEESARQFRLLSESLPQIIWTARADEVVDYCNQRFSEYTGLPVGAARSWHELIHPEDLAHILGLRRELPDGQGFEVEYRLRRADGAYRWHLLRAEPLLNAAGKAVRWIGTSTDVHDRILAERERERLLREVQDAVRARDEFIAVASHDLRTPAMALQLHLDALWRLCRREPTTDGRVVQKVERARAQMARMTVLLNNLLDTSRIAAGRLTLELQDMDLGELLREVIGRFAPDLDAAGCAVEVDIPEGVMGRWDRARLDQVLVNLLSNAVKYGAGHPIAVRLERREGRARITVEDHGIGIAGEAQAQIFERFQRAVDERLYMGVGLGLWIVRQLVDAHGGQVGVKSELGQGAAFTVELPLPAPVP